ncbi:sigma-54-dependent Fis family transcriptional regulator [Mucilaginibacter psychrotolerans]|uniref:Sigma-54-dependent Fis family transcriptional regulator n=2 Tax=Mucilaginibacter psychrotolerans TaxID=1524096 RepID=A0A4Y8S9A3_9SPHI|nr:sigma-54-dependent Fis family transcriptional regulator [Mucilaginibacter psychrotolerans]
MYYPVDTQVGSRLLRLVSSVTVQLSIVIENIFADEREALFASQKSILFSLGQHVSTAGDFSGLTEALDKNVKSVLGYYQSEFKILDEDKSILFPRVGQTGSEGVNTSDCLIGCLKQTKTKPIKDILSISEPRLYDLSDTSVAECFSESSYLGVSFVLVTRLEVDGKILGLWIICYTARPEVNPDYLNLVKGIRDTLSLGVFNLILNEKIKRREHEKSSLLEFSRAVAGVRDKLELGVIFHSFLKNLCNLDELSLHWLSEDKSSQYCYLWDTDSRYAGDPYFMQEAESTRSVNDGVIDQVLSTSAPVFVSTEELSGLPDCPGYLTVFKRYGFRSIAALPIFKGKEIVAVLFVKEYHLGEADQPLLRSLCSQLAIAISDLIATERVIHQLGEINRYKERLEEEKIYLTRELEITHNYSEIIGKSPLLDDVFKMISQVAISDSTVLILGETGTGKELIARAIHNNSPRRNSLLVKVNCAALPANLIESELFGHEKGSFTGATERRVGKFELANGGTLFLDEIGEMPPELQVKLLRALQEKEIERIGGRGVIRTDVRIVAATNRDLEKEINSGRFRSDLYFRINTFPIHLPALRDRADDIPLLALHFVRRFAKRAGKEIVHIGSSAMKQLMSYSWPGNVRELEHQIERCVLMTKGSVIKDVYLPSPFLPVIVKEASSQKFVPGKFDDFEKDYILKTLKYCNGKVSGAGGAAELLGIPASTLTSRMKRLNISKKIVEKHND